LGSGVPKKKKKKKKKKHKKKQPHSLPPPQLPSQPYEPYIDPLESFAAARASWHSKLVAAVSGACAIRSRTLSAPRTGT
jgi:hypothetical protein